MNNRELDERVARALGWTTNDWVPKYSIDYACVPEMLAWLRDRVLSVDITHYFTGAGIHKPVYVMASAFQEHGATIPEALSRLVVAVAEAKEAGQ